MRKALAYGLSVIKEKIDGEITSISVEVSCEMLNGQDVMNFVVESGLQPAPVHFI